MFGKKPSSSSYAGRQDALQDRALARELVRKSLVLLKNDTGALPLSRGKRILVVGEGADSLPLQTGGWSLSWQGNGNQNSDFPHADTILAGIEEVNGKDKVVYSADATGVDVSAFDAVIAVLAESPYAEGAGDIVATGTMRHTSRYPHELEMLQRVAGKGKPVVTVLLSGRPLWTNDVMNLSDSFVAAWLPGTEGKGVADVLFKGGQPFSGKLSFSWPRTACQAVVNLGERDYAPLFKVGYGLASGVRSQVGQLDAAGQEAGCGDSHAMAVYQRGNHASWPLAIASGGQRLSLGRDLANVAELPGIRVENGEIGPAQEGKRVTWTGPARFEARASAPRAVPAFAATGGVLRFDAVVAKAPAGIVKLGFGAASLDATAVFAGFAGKAKQTISIPLVCFTSRGADPSSIDTPFSVESDGPFTAVFGNIQVVGGAAGDASTLACASFK
jgi:beta-glucosidase